MSRTMPLSHLLPDVALAHDPQIGGLALDSRHIRPGDAFVAIAGFGAFLQQFVGCGVGDAGSDDHGCDGAVDDAFDGLLQLLHVTDEVQPVVLMRHSGAVLFQPAHHG